MRRFNLPGDDCPGKRLIANAHALEMVLWKHEDGTVELSYKVSGSIDVDEEGEAPVDPQQFARELMAAFTSTKGGTL
jgi:hypothetical protein